MLIVKGRWEFLKKHAKTCSPDALFKNYEYYFEKYKSGDCPKKTAEFGDCLPYLKRLLINYKPKYGMIKAFYLEGHKYSRDELEEAYVYYLTRVAEIEEFYKDYLMAAFFARKALDMVDYFRPYANKSLKQEIWQEWPYKTAMDIYEDYQEHMSDEYYKAYALGWEIEFYSPTNNANQNFSEPVLV